MYKIFHLSNKPAYPLKDGGCIAISSILQSLLFSSETKLFHFSFSTHKHKFDIDLYPAEWRKKMQIENMFVNTKVNALGASLHLLKNKSYNISRFYDKNVEDRIKQILSQQSFGFAIFEGTYLLPYLSIFKNKGIKVILRAHNIEHKIWDLMAKNTESNLKKKYLQRLAQQLKNYELSRVSQVDGIMTISNEDEDYFRSQFPKIPIISIPPIMNIQAQNYEPDYSKNDFYFLGSMDWKPNIEGIDWFLEKVIPGGIENAKFHLAGKGLKKGDYNHHGIVNEGEVENAFDFIQQHGICINPVHSGSGLKIKLLENMAMGKPIITTSEGARGVNVTHGKELLMTNYPNEFKEFMFQLNLNENKRRELGKNARDFILNNYNEKIIAEQTFEFIKNIS